jgi:hypothetical protein
VSDLPGGGGMIHESRGMVRGETPRRALLRFRLMKYRAAPLLVVVVLTGLFGWSTLNLLVLVLGR